MKWFSISGIAKEVKKTRWASKKDVFNSSLSVIVFSLFFIAFFVLFDLISVALIKFIG